MIRKCNLSRSTDQTGSGAAMGRRRFLHLAAAGSGAALAALGRPALAQQGPGGGLTPVHWSGRLMGAESSLVLHHDDAAVARRALAAVLARVRALEGVFSLHRSDSALSRLNAHGALTSAPAPLLDLLRCSQRLHAATDGAFDPSIQPLFALYASHFSTPGADPDGPPPQAIAAARARTGFSAVRLGRTSVHLLRPGMALTLNGIAQGYITDQASAVLKRFGLAHCLVNFGEYRALGPRSSGRPWVIGLSAPRAPWRLEETVQLRGGAIATSAGAGTQFDAAGRFSHLINPHSGRSSAKISSISVIAPSAALADALSTALAVTAKGRIAPILRHFGQAGALLRWRNGETTRLRFPSHDCEGQGADPKA